MLRRKMITISIIILYSIYAFAYATFDAFIDYKVLLIFSFLASLILFPSKKLLFSQKVGFLYLYFLGLSSFSILFRTHAYAANIDSLVRSLFILLLSGPIVACFVDYDESDNTFFKWGLLCCFLTFVLAAVLYQFGIPVKKVFPGKPGFAGFVPVFHDWNQKYYAAWLVFLMWGTISFHWRENTLGASLAIGLIILTSIAIFTGYSDSAKGALILSVMIFMIMHIKYSRWLLLWQSLICLYILTFPLVWYLLSSGWLSSIESVNLNNADFRVNLYSFAANAIQKHWLWGYGFGSAPTVLAPFPVGTGGHPHNIVLYFWLELGILGAFLLAVAATALLSFIHDATRGRHNAPAVWALFSSGLVIFSFSFDLWFPGIVLIYDMWLAMIMLSCQNTMTSHSLVQTDPHESNSCGERQASREY